MLQDSFFTLPLSGVLVPKDSSWLRKHVRPEARRSKHYLERYDQHTLLYDCFFNPAKGCFTLTSPRLLNQWPLLSQHLLANDQPYTGRRKRSIWQRCEQINIYAPESTRLSVEIDGSNFPIHTRNTRRDVFGGLNCALAMNKDNRLEWIRDWVRFHVNAHGLEGVCIIDNASTDYSSHELLEVIRKVEGLKAAAVIEADYPYGPADGSKKLEVSPRFLQTSMFNIVKQDLFADARAVLSVDIDELVIPNTPQSIFDAAVASFIGAVSFRELKVYPQDDEERAYGQPAHTLVKSDGKLGNTKWCVSGDGFINRFGWAVHRFGGGYFLLTESTDFNYLHCQATSTSWKKNRYKKPSGLVESSIAKNALARFLP